MLSPHNWIKYVVSKIIDSATCLIVDCDFGNLLI